jgi:hypothetical protein
VSKFGESCLSLMFIAPIISTLYSRASQNVAIFITFKNVLDN